MQDFLHMDGYGAYVWSCFGLTFAVLIYNAWSARHQLRAQVVKAKRRVQVADGIPS